MTDITTTLVVNFQSSATGAGETIQAEIDGRTEGLNLGNTTFSNGDQPGFLIYLTPNVTLTGITPSTGVIQTLPSEDIEFTETLTFAKERQASVSKPMKNLAFTSFKWIGNNLGTPIVVDSKTVSVPIEGVGVMKITYTARALRRRLTNVAVPTSGENEFDVLILIEGTGP